MERRSFLLGLCGVAGAAVAASTTAGLLATTAQATPLDQLKNLPMPDRTEPEMASEPAGEAPDGTPIEDAQYWRRQRRRYYRRRRRRICRVYRDRWGRPFRRCWWGW